MILLKKLLLFACILSTFNANATKLSLQISNHSVKNKVILDFQNGKEDELIIDGTGKGELNLSDITPGYVTLVYGMIPRTLWLEPTKELSISFDAGDFAKQLTFSGSLANINRYLNDSKLQEIMINDCNLGEKAFLMKADSLLKDNLQKLQLAKLPENFTNVEQTRLTYFTYSGLPYFSQFYPRISKDSTYVPSVAYLDKVKELCVANGSLLKLEAYKSYLINAVYLLAKQEMPEIPSTMDRNIAFVKKNINEASVSGYLIGKLVTSYIKRYGTQDADKYITVFQKYVTDSTIKDELNKLCEKWDKLKVGKPSPAFNAKDVSGKKVSIEDLKGKFVYIDIWATWCAPCRKEIPYLMQLEEKYKDKSIHFVSLSCDASFEAWEKSLAKGDKKGIQIRLEPDDTFMDDYMITGIPRFILLDKEGNIINPDMTRPSEQETTKTFDELLK